MKVSAIILGAGLSSRMGDENKLFLDFHGQPILQQVISNVKESIAHEVILVSSEVSVDKLDDLDLEGVKVVENKNYQEGMTSSIKTGVQNADPNTDGFMICLGDQPGLTSEVLNEIIGVFNTEPDPHKIVVPFHKGQKGNPVIFSCIYKSEILDHKEPEGCRQIIKDHLDHQVRVNISSKSVLEDIDTEEDYIKIVGGR